MKNEFKIIFVDLDGTLIRTDLFIESILMFLKQNPLNIFRFLRWLFKGRSVAKTLVAKKVKVDVKNLPYEIELIEYLQEKKEAGHRIILCTASHWSYANKVATYLDLFDGVLASNAKNNLKGRKKLKKILEVTGNDSFAYAGDSAADRPIWEKSSANIHINSRKSDIARSKTQDKFEKLIESRGKTFKTFIREMRPHQYAKNVLIFVPLVTSHGYNDKASLVACIWAFLCFSLCASGVYLLNDLLDLPADRQHQRKKHRPLASGELSLAAGLLGALGLPLISFALAWFVLPLNFILTLAAYFIITNVYSFYLKSISTADVMALAVLYTLRVIAGAAAINVELSSWLLAFSIFIFVSLAYLKRYIEVAALDEDSGKAQGRGYSFADRETMFNLGISNGTASVLVLALYISSNDVKALYPNPQFLWLLCLLLLYWSNRIWVGARRGKINEDPVVFAIKDRVSRMVLLAFLLIIVMARYF